jgi:hypothetical protein
MSRLPLSVASARVARRGRALRWCAGVLGVAFSLGCEGATADTAAALATAQPMHDAMEELTATMVYDIFSPPQASRVYAYASIAAFEATRHQDSSWLTLSGQLREMPAIPVPDRAREYAWSLAGMRALLTVGHALTFSRERMDSVRSAMTAQYARVLDRAVYDRSVAFGDSVATAVLAWADQDGFKQSRGMPKFSVTSKVGRWVPTPPAYMDAVEPGWGSVKPFTLDSATQYRPAAAIPFDTSRTSPFFQHVLEVYEKGRTLTDDERAVAAFWDCNPYVMNVQGHTMFAIKKISPGGHWMGIAGLASRKVRATSAASADAYARTAIALADGFIVAWEEKYRSGVIRPETIINAYLDEAWVPLLQTPPFPEYPSGHSVISTAAARVLTSIFGDAFAFDDSVEVRYGLPVRRFESFDAAAEEAAISRLFGGIHFRPAIEEGQKQGRLVGDHVVQRVVTRPRPTIARK